MSSCIPTHEIQAQNQSYALVFPSGNANLVLFFVSSVEILFFEVLENAFWQSIKPIKRIWIERESEQKRETEIKGGYIEDNELWLSGSANR